MNRFSQFSEDDLIAYHLHELPRLRAWSLKRALERDTELAAESEAIAATLRVFCDAPTPAVDEAMLERSWGRVRSSLAVLPETRPRRAWSLWSAVAAGTLAAAIAAVIWMARPASDNGTTPGVASNASARLPLVAETKNVLAKLHGKHTPPAYVGQRPGPLTTAPVDAIAGDPQMAAYLDSAERLLTEVVHEDGPPTTETRSQAHRLLLQNAVYQRSAQDRGDLAAAGVMDDLGRVLVSLDAEPPQNARGADAFRMQMNVGNVLFDLRILHRNPSSSATE